MRHGRFPMPCPPQDLLAAFAQGTADPPAAEEIARHLDECPVCLAEIGMLTHEPDRFVLHLRESAAAESYTGEPQFQNALEQLLADLAARPTGANPPLAADSANSRDLAGRRLRDYLLMERIGEGGMGTVYRARHLRLDKVVAVKVVSPRHLRRPQSMMRFEREMKALGRVSHPSIVRAHDAGECEGTVYLVMEMIEGLDAGEIVHRLGPLPVADACEIIRQVAEALHHVHELGMVHRDIKPSNLMITRAGEVKLLDLGLALLHDEVAWSGELTDTGQVMGTVDYMAPEQFGDSHHVDIRADIYSLGCALYKLLTGHPPYGAAAHRSVFKRFLAHAREPVPDVSALRTEVSPALAEIVSRCLAKEPGERFEIPRQLADAITPYAMGHRLGETVRNAPQRKPTFDVDPDYALVSTSRSLPARRTQDGFPTRRDAKKMFSTDVAWRERPGRRKTRWRLTFVPVAVTLFLLSSASLAYYGWFTKPRVPPDTPITNAGTVPSDTASAGKAASKDTQYDVLPAWLTPEPIRVTESGAMSRIATVSVPPRLPGALSWTIETAHHRWRIHAIAASPDSQWLATAGADTAIRLWDPETGELKKLFVAHDSAIIFLKASPDGRFLASADETGVTHVWFVPTGKLVRSHKSQEPLLGLSWCDDGRRLAIGTAGHVLVWDLANAGQPSIVYTASAAEIRAIDWRQGSLSEMRNPVLLNIIAVAQGTRIVFLDARSIESPRTVVTESTDITALSWSRTGGLIAWAVAGNPVRVRISAIDVDVSVRDIELPANIKSIHQLAWSRDIDFLAAMENGSHEIFVWSREDPEIRLRYGSPGKQSDQLCWLPDSDHIVSSSRDGSIYFWSRVQGREMRVIPFAGKQILRDAIWSHEGDAVILVLEDRPGALLDAASGKILWHAANALAAAWSSQARLLADATRSPHELTIRDTTGNIKQKWDLPSGAQHLEWSPSGGQLAVACHTRLLLASLDMERELRSFGTFQGELSRARWSHDGKYLAVKADPSDTLLTIWNVSTGDEVGRINTTSTCHDLAWSPVRNSVAAACELGVEIYSSTESGKWELTDSLENTRSEFVDWAPDGTRLAVSHQGLVSVWNIGERKQVWSTDTLETSFRMVSCRWSPRGNVVLAAQLNGDIRLLDARHGEVAGSLFWFNRTGSEMRYTAIDHTGNYVAVGNADAELVYVVQTAEGQQTLLPWEFQERFDWRNDPTRVNLRKVGL